MMKIKKIVLLLFAAILYNCTTKAQDKAKDFNGIWQNNSDPSVYYILFDGKYISFYLSASNFVNSIETGKYGFYPDSIDVDNLKTVSLDQRNNENYKLAFVSDKGGVIGYEYEIGDRILNLYNQNDFFYQKLYVLPPNIILKIKSLAKAKNIDLENFIYSEETIGTAKATIYSAPNIKSKMYLIKGDTVKITEENGNWLRFEYKGKSLIKGWIRKQDLQ